MWTKEETDELFELCARFDLRFIVIADKLPSSRTVEELKNRYYSGTSANMFSCLWFFIMLFILHLMLMHEFINSL